MLGSAMCPRVKALWLFVRPACFLGIAIAAVACPLVVLVYGAAPAGIFVVAVIAGVCLTLLMLGAGFVVGGRFGGSTQ